MQIQRHFRIKGPIPHKSSRAENHNDQQEPNICDDNLSKADEIKLSTLLQSFEKIITSLVSSNKATESSNIEYRKSNRSDQVDFRDRFVMIDLPDFDNRKVDEEKLEAWLGELCSEILSVAFYYLTEKKMNYDQIKAFTSESFLRNLVILADKFDLTFKEM